MNFELPKLKCLRCGHEWIPRRPIKPKVCPKCTSPYWDKPKWKGIDKGISVDLEADKADICTFRYIKSSASSWSGTADRLASAAYKFELDRDTQDNRLVASTFSEVYYMLIGFALENYYKGAIVAKLLKNSRGVEEGKLDSVLKNHVLSRLAYEAGVKVKDRLYKSYLEYLTECVLWRGRYPLPTDASRIGGSMTYHPPEEGGKYHIVVGLSHAIPVEIVHDLIEQARENLDSMRRKSKASNRK
jgi:hypothetical protein